MTMRDLHTYVAPERAPTRMSYRGLDVYGMGPPSSGGSTVGEALNILEGYPLATETRERQLHLFLEASRYAFADRGAYLGDADYVRVPLRGLLSDGFAATRRALITETAAPGAVAAGDPWPFEDAVGLLLAGASVDQEGLSTTHLSVSDRWGNVVSYTFTIESTGGAGLVVPGWGFLLNNELTDFDYALLNHPNSVAGGKRPRSSMAPTIVTQGGRTLLTVGSPGGSTIITTVLQLLLDRLDTGMTLPQAIADPRATQRNGATTQAEPAFRASPLAAALEARGHVFVTNPEIAPRPGSSSCRPAASSRPPSRRVAAAAARWWSRRCPSRVEVPESGPEGGDRWAAVLGVVRLLGKSEQQVRVHRLFLPFHPQPGSRLDQRVGRQLRTGGGADEHATGRGESLQPRARVDHVADQRVRHVAVAADLADNRLTAVDADAQARPVRMLLSVSRRGVLEGERRARSADGVVGLVAAAVERRDDPVADEVLDLAPEARVMSGAAKPKYALSIAATSAGGERSEKLVKPARSPKSAVTS